jgi:hypothetical protein
MLITSFFTNNGVPATGLTPTILIYSVTGTGEALIVTADPMLEVGNGFYQYVFIGYNSTSNYLFRTDGGSSLDITERYQVGTIDVSAIDPGSITDISNSVWESTATNFTTSGTTGMLLNQIDSTTSAIAGNLYVNANSVLDLINLLLEYETNRTLIDPVAKTLTIFQNDCATPLRIFELLDTTGTPSITEVAERRPVYAADGLPVCS